MEGLIFHFASNFADGQTNIQTQGEGDGVTEDRDGQTDKQGNIVGHRRKRLTSI